MNGALIALFYEDLPFIFVITFVFIFILSFNCVLIFVKVGLKFKKGYNLYSYLLWKFVQFSGMFEAAKLSTFRINYITSIIKQRQIFFIVLFREKNDIFF